MHGCWEGVGEGGGKPKARQAVKLPPTEEEVRGYGGVPIQK